MREDRDVGEDKSTGETLSPRDGFAAAAHTAQLADVGGPLAHGAAQAVGAADAAKVGLDLARGKDIRAIDAAGAAASVTMSSGLGGPVVQLGAQGVALASGLDAADRGGNTLKAIYGKEVATPTAADADLSAPPGQTAEQRARTDLEALRLIDDKGEHAKAVAAMARITARDEEYGETLKRLDPFTAEAVALATQGREAPNEHESASASARRAIERTNDDGSTVPPDSVALPTARDWVAGNLAALKSIDNDADLRSALVAMGVAANYQKHYKHELARQDLTVATAAALAYERDQRLQVDKEDRKAAEIQSGQSGANHPGATDRLVASLDERMAKSELEERGWKGRDDLSDVMRDLEKLAGQDWQRAADLWEKYRPGDIDKPAFIDGEDARSTLRSAVRTDNAVDRDQKEADRGQPEPKEAEFLTPESIRKRFIQAENKYYFREEENKLAFEDKGKRLATAHDHPEVARSMVELAEAKGWDAVKVRGTEEFKRVVWLQASLRGMEVDGFKPKPVDLARLEELKAEAGRSAERPARNVVEQTTVRQRSAQPDQALDREAVVDEHQRTLSGPQRQAVEALKAILRDRGDSEQAVNMAADAAASRFQNNRVHVGKILAHGQAPYENNPNNASSYFVKLQTPKGEKEVWGVDLRRAIEDGKAKVGDDVALAYQGRQKVTVQVKDRDAQGRVVGHSSVLVDRNTWDVNRLDAVRDDVRKQLAEAAARTDSRQPLVKVYDRNAPREDLRPEPSREHARRNERTR